MVYRAMVNRNAAAMLSDMPDLRRAIVDELGRRKWTTYRLVQELKGKRPDGRDVPSATIYEFIQGKSPINSSDLGLIFDVLGIELKRSR